MMDVVWYKVAYSRVARSAWEKHADLVVASMSSVGSSSNLSEEKRKIIFNISYTYYKIPLVK